MKNKIKPKNLNHIDIEKQQRRDRKEIRKKNISKKDKKIGWKIFKIVLLVILAVGVIGIGIVFGVVSSIIDSTDPIELTSLSDQDMSSIILDKDGNEIQVLQAGENRIWVEYNNIPKDLINAVIAIEDERFYTHPGIDFKRTAAAVVTYILSGGNSDFGGSTVTQQLVKNITEDKETSWKRKVREWYRAISLETQIDKDSIMGYYLNTVYLGENAHGVNAASYTYFNKDVSELNLAECALLAAQIQMPASTNPYASEESKAALFNRQKIVLGKMLELGFITNEQYEEAINKEVVFEKGVLGQATATTSYYVDAVIEAVIEDLVKQKGIDKSAAEVLLYTGGYTIYSNQDSALQKTLNESFADANLFYVDDDGSFMQSAMVVMDHKTGKVLGIIGGADNKVGSRTLNRATQMRKQPGSCMKPIGAYGPAIELGIVSAGTGVDDSPNSWGGYAPHNYYPGYHGFVTVRDAIARSMNLPAVRTCAAVGVEYAYNFAYNLGFTQMTTADMSLPSLALGGLANAPTVLQMAAAYSTFANEGIYISPTFYTEVKDRNGELVVKPEVVRKRVMKDTTAFIVTSCLQTTITAGTATGNVTRGNIDLAGKTGNTNDDFDQWFIGYSPYYTIACWNGYDENRVIGSRRALHTYPYTSLFLFNRVQERIHAGLPAATFNVPAGIVSVTVCRDSGLVATDACRHDQRGNRERADIFASGSIPTATCTVHKEAEVCKVTGKLAGKYCETKTVSFITRPKNVGKNVEDWAYMLPTETCTECKKKEPEKKPEVDVYGGSSTGTSKPSSSTTKPSGSSTTKPSSSSKDDGKDDKKDNKVDIY